MDTEIADIIVHNLNTKKNTKKQQEVINFRRRTIPEDGFNTTNEIILLDPTTALESEPLTIEVKEEEDYDNDSDQEHIIQITDGVSLLSNLVGEESFDLQDGTIVVEELGEGEHPLDDLELEEGEIKVPGFEYLRKSFTNSYHPSHEYLCPLCSKSFAQKGNLLRHYNTHTGVKPFGCNLCGHKFTQKSNLQKHIATHNGDKKFECGACHKSFVQKANLIRHLRIHTGEKPFECELCGHRFTQKGNLNKHMQLHTADGEATCDYCDSKFSSFGAKTRHETIVHKTSLDETSRGELLKLNLQCDECPAVFRRESALMKHKKFHE